MSEAVHDTHAEMVKVVIKEADDRRIGELEKRVGTLEMYLKAAVIVALIFGGSGAWGLRTLTVARAQVDSLGTAIGPVKTDLVAAKNDLSAVKEEVRLASRSSKEVDAVAGRARADINKARDAAVQVVQASASAAVEKAAVPVLQGIDERVRRIAESPLTSSTSGWIPATNPVNHAKVPDDYDPNPVACPSGKAVRSVRLFTWPKDKQLQVQLGCTP